MALLMYDAVQDVMEDVHEFCYVLTHVLKLHELLNYSLEKVSILRQRVADKINVLHRKKMLAKSWLNYGSNVCESNTSECAELKDRLCTLEGEVAELKRHMEQLLSDVPSNRPEPIPPTTINLPTIPELTVVPPPPPPPPPPLPPPSATPTASGISSARSSRNTLRPTQSFSTNDHLDMATVLRGLKDVKLRPTEKSPGGTPLRRMAVHKSNDPHDVIRMALKRRFECIHVNDSDNKENTDDSWEYSPNLSYV